MVRHRRLSRIGGRLPDPGRPGDPEAPELPPVVMPEEDGRRWWRGLPRWTVILGGVLLTAGAAWAIGLVEVPSLRSGGAGEALARDSSPPEGDAASLQFGAPPGSSGFDRLRESLEASLEAYRRRHADFERGRIPCDVLVAGYREVDGLVVSLAARWSEIRTAEAEREQVYGALLDDAAEVDRLFDRSGCPRP